MNRMARISNGTKISYDAIVNMFRRVTNFVDKQQLLC